MQSISGPMGRAVECRAHERAAMPEATCEATPGYRLCRRTSQTPSYALACRVPKAQINGRSCAHTTLRRRRTEELFEALSKERELARSSSEPGRPLRDLAPWLFGTSRARDARRIIPLGSDPLHGTSIPHGKVLRLSLRPRCALALAKRCVERLVPMRHDEYVVTRHLPSGGRVGGVGPRIEQRSLPPLPRQNPQDFERENIHRLPPRTASGDPFRRSFSLMELRQAALLGQLPTEEVGVLADCERVVLGVARRRRRRRRKSRNLRDGRPGCLDALP